MTQVLEIASKLIETRRLTEDEYVLLLSHSEDKALRDMLSQEAVRLREYYYGKKVFTRGLIEFTNYCKNGCYYCGISRENANVARYRLTKEEILSCCDQGYGLGFRTFVLQGGEDLYYNDDRMVDIVRSIKERYPECAVTLSIGERSYESYKKLREAGADRYLLRHETADCEHYGRLHPEEMKLSDRMQCLKDLKSLGFQVGAGFMVGSPYQTLETMAKDLVFLQEFEPQMVGIGPFIPHHETRFHDQPAGTVDMTLFLLSIIRIMLPKVLLPATTALSTLDVQGREKGMMHGANVVMPNLSPMENRAQYTLYDHKVFAGTEAAEHLQKLALQMASVGYELVTERGDHADI